MKICGRFGVWAVATITLLAAAPAILLAQPDLTVTNLQAPAEAVTDARVLVSWSVLNQGGDPATGSWYDNIFFSTDGTWDAADTQLGTSLHSGGLAAGSNYTATATVTVPRVPTGTYYLIVWTDRASNVIETNEVNNRLVLPIHVVVPDLTVTDLQAPAQAATDARIQVSWTVLNQGSGSATAPWSDNVFFSTNTTWEVADTQLGFSSRTTGLGAGSNYTATATVTVPRVQPGTYYLILWTDRSGNLFEADEANNRRVIPITVVAPDLTVAEVQAPAEAVSEARVQVSWTVLNQGEGSAASSWYDNVFFSTDATWDAADTQVGNSYRTAGLGVGSNYTATVTVTVPRVSAGTYYLIVWTDRSGNLFETDETNNRRAIPINVLVPDLTVTDLQAPAEAVSDARVQVTWTVLNQGNGLAAAPWTDNVFFSTNDTWETSDTQLGFSSRSTDLGVGSTYTATVTVTVPRVQPGDYYLIVWTDRAADVFEADETNNRRVIPIKVVVPDLVVTDLQGPTEAVPDARVQVNWTVANQGNGVAAASWYDNLYFSTNDTWESTDTQLGTSSHTSSLAPGSNYTATVTATVPRVPSGTYYLILWTDRSAGLFEADETNNRRVIPIRIVVPDLTVSDLRSLEKPLPGQSVTVSWTVVNLGDGLAVAPWYDHVFFSTNNTWEAADPQLGFHYHQVDLPAGSNYTATANVVVPATATGTFYLIVKTDRPNALFEADETNNTRVVPWSDAAESPVLSIRLVNDQTELSWPASAAGFELESAAHVGSGVTWEPVTNAVNTVGDRSVCTFGPAASNQFYRLRKMGPP